MLQVSPSLRATAMMALNKLDLVLHHEKTSKGLKVTSLTVVFGVSHLK